jgi:hypothetical protein
MVMHPHTKYHWPISKDKKIMVRTSFAEKKQKKKIRLKQYVSLHLKGRHNKFTSYITHWKIVIIVTNTACNVNITSFNRTGFIPLGWSFLYSTCEKKIQINIIYLLYMYIRK